MYKLNQNGLWGPELDEYNYYNEAQLINEVLHRCNNTYTNDANYASHHEAQREPKIDRMLSYYERHAGDDYIHLSICDKVAYKINEYLNTLTTDPEDNHPWNGSRDFLISNRRKKMFVGVFQYANEEIHITTHVSDIHDIIIKDGSITCDDSIFCNRVMSGIYEYLLDHINEICIL